MNGQGGEPLERFLTHVQGVTLFIFTAEVVIKVLACGDKPLDYFRHAEEGTFNMCAHQNLATNVCVVIVLLHDAIGTIFSWW